MDTTQLDLEDDTYSVADAELNAEAEETEAIASDHIYMSSFTLGEFHITTYQEFVQHSDAIYSLLVELMGEPSANSLWADCYRDMTDLSDREEMDLASRDFVMGIELARIENPVPVDLRPLGPISLESLDIPDIHELKGVLAEFDLDDPRLYGRHTGFSVPPQTDNRRSEFAYRPKVPPLGPLTPNRAPSLLVLKSQAASSDTMPLFLTGPYRTYWSDIIEQRLQLAPGTLPANTFDESSTRDSLSNKRPGSHPAVTLMWDDGLEVNIGVHGFELKQDKTFVLDFVSLTLALQELFSAPGGEGLTNPTPSHLLHQMVNAIMSSALSFHHEVLVEKDTVDILCDGYAIDITSSGSLWKKPLKPDLKSPHYRRQAAVSKYDIAAVVSAFCEPSVATVILKAVANCLATEYPDSWHIEHEDVSTDMKLQQQIYRNLASMPAPKLEQLAELAYEAAAQESLREIAGFRLQEPGSKFRDKAHRLLTAVQNLRPRNKIAFPPVCLSEISGGFSQAFSLVVQGHHLTAGPYVIERKSEGTRYVMDNIEQFLNSFPASGLVSHQESKDLCQVYDNCYKSACGSGNPGPCSDSAGSDPRLVAACNRVYSQNAFAQLAEVQADVVRAVNALPFPQPNVWQQVYVYQGRVAVWYRSRDPVNSPEGYRIDWFAVSKFEVCGAVAVDLGSEGTGYLWPRQRLRSQEMELRGMAPRRLKYTLYSLLEKCRATKTSFDEACLAWNRLAITCTTSTWASGELFKTCRYLSASLSSPSSPFDTMATKLKRPVNLCDILYLHRLTIVLSNWESRDKYHSVCPILGLPRSFSQLESYWLLWVPDEYADSTKHMASCAMDLCDEYMLVKSTAAIRIRDLEAQVLLSGQEQISISELRASLRASCSLDTSGKLGWSWVGSLAAGHALVLKSDPRYFDKQYARGTTHKTLSHHMTVRHSAYIKPDATLDTGTVAEMMISAGMDPLFSIVTPLFRFLFLNRPVFFNHPKKGEHKDREISITDPDSRIALNAAELICGHYGRTTGVDYLKIARKDQIFYKSSSYVLRKGGVIQSSDASRYGPMMSNFAIAIMLLVLGTRSMHLKWASVVYARLAYRQMCVPKNIIPELTKLCAFADTHHRASQTLSWVTKMPVRYVENGSPVGWYCTSVHMGQGMSHHSSSLLHAGGLVVSQDCLLRAEITVNGKQIIMLPRTMVTSDDSTLLPMAHAADDGEHLTRRERQTACHIFLKLQRQTRNISLRMVSVMPNLPKEVIAGTRGEFNSQDTGIGLSCPILGFREGIALLVAPSAPSLIGDYMAIHAHSKTVAFCGQGMECGNYFHALSIDAVEQRWYLSGQERKALEDSPLIPGQLIRPASGTDLASSPASWLSPHARGFLLRQSIEKNSQLPDLDPHSKDAVFSPLMHVKIAMSKQHRTAIASIKTLVKEYQSIGNVPASKLLSECLSETLSSARTRNLGRVASRIKFRKVKPRQWISESFESDTVIHHTLSWIQYLSNKFMASSVGIEDIALGNSVSGFIRFSPGMRYFYPLPPLRRTFNPPVARKPKYMTSDYGVTPFGAHAVERSRTTLVSKISQVERAAVQTHLARQSYRRFTEHVTYGDTFVTSWHRGTGQTLVAIDVRSDVEAQMIEHVKWGSFDPDSITVLQRLQMSNPGIPVLAIHRYVDGHGLWHGIYKSSPMTVTRRIDLEGLDSNFILTTDEHNKSVCLALQGFSADFDWQGSGPRQREVEEYLSSPFGTQLPAIVSSVERENMLAASTQLPTYSTSVMLNGSPVFVCVAPEAHTTPYDNPAYVPRIRYFRSKVITELATAGYWHSSLRGTAFRAYIRGHWHDDTIWTGGVIGWKMSATDLPSYGTTWHQTTSIQALYALNEISNAELLSPFNPNLFGKGIRVVAGSSTYSYMTAIRATVGFIPLILAKNNGRRHEITDSVPGFIDLTLGAPERQPAALSPHAAEAEIQSMLFGLSFADDGW